MPDEIVIDLVKKCIEECEAEPKEGAEENANAGWILEGFPRTRMQALALQQMGFKLDKFFLLQYPDETAEDNLK